MNDTDRVITGQRIVRLLTIGSMYNNDSIIAVDDQGKHYRIKTNQLIKLFNDNIKMIVVKNVRHEYLNIIEVGDFE